MSQNLTARQQMSNAITPVICFSIAVLLFAFAGREILMSLLEEDPVDAANMQIIMVIIFGVMLLGFIAQFVKAYKKFVQEKNAPPRPPTPAQPTAELVRARQLQHVQAGVGYQQPGSSVTYSTSPEPARYANSPVTHTIEKERVIIKEIVKIKCSYCGMLADHGLNECPNCGGRL